MKVKKQQTAIDWFVENYFGEIETSNTNLKAYIKAAKEMEKQLIIDAHHEASPETGALSYDLAKDYYIETFGL